jgi:23S rRNA (uracil1939-C5)-methyltransferase
MLVAAGATAVVFAGRRADAAPRTRLRADGFEYHVSAGTFFQANWELNGKLLGLVAGEAERLRPVSVIDLYAGAGNFSLAAAPFAKKVIAVEESAAACRDGEHNARKNRIRNVTFVESAVADFRMPQGADLLVLDPPRGGLSGGVVREILRAAPGLVLYVSCNPATFARDAGALGRRYALRSLRVVDMFPQTCHMEVLGVLDRRGSKAGM